MGVAMVFLPLRGSVLKSGVGVDLVDEDVAVLGLGNEIRVGDGVTGDDDGLMVSGLELVAVGVLPGAVLDSKCGDGDILISKDLLAAGFREVEFMHVDLVSVGISSFEALRAFGDVLGVGSEEMVGHVPEAGWAEGFEWFAATDDCGAEDDVGVADGVVGMEVGDKEVVEIC